jgi:hypothetical protein
MDPYKDKLIAGSLCSKKTLVRGRVVAVMDAKLSRRGLQLIISPTRVLLSGQIHELIVTDEEDAGPGKVVNRIAYVGFFELEKGGVVTKGDKVILQGKSIGEIVGFDETHAPNHLNIVIKSSKRKNGEELGVELGDRLTIG